MVAAFVDLLAAGRGVFAVGRLLVVDELFVAGGRLAGFLAGLVFVSGSVSIASVASSALSVAWRSAFALAACCFLKYLGSFAMISCLAELGRRLGATRPSSSSSRPTLLPTALPLPFAFFFGELSGLLGDTIAADVPERDDAWDARVSFCPTRFEATMDQNCLETYICASLGFRQNRRCVICPSGCRILLCGTREAWRFAWLHGFLRRGLLEWLESERCV